MEYVLRAVVIADLGGLERIAARQFVLRHAKMEERVSGPISAIVLQDGRDLVAVIA